MAAAMMKAWMGAALAAACSALAASDAVAEPSAVQLGTFNAWEAPSARVRILNRSGKELRVLACRASCGCLTAAMDRTSVGPGGAVVLDVKVLSRAAGVFSHSVYVEFDGMAPLRIPVTGRAVQLMTFHPGERVALGARPAGSAVSQSFEISLSADAVLGEPSAEGCEASLEAMSPRRRILHVRGVAPAARGPFRLRVSIPVESPYRGSAEIVLYGNSIQNQAEEAE